MTFTLKRENVGQYILILRGKVDLSFTELVIYRQNAGKTYDCDFAVGW
jgi:hypothetical protein